MWDKFSTKCEAHLTESIFQTRSRACYVYCAPFSSSCSSQSTIL
ncbi:DUF6783 domain-containing protein [Thomasclavelia cocleata]